MTRYCFALDLKNDPALIAEYEVYHKKVWPEILSSIKDAGIDKLDIYRTGNRLFMFMDARDDFSLEVTDAAKTLLSDEGYDPAYGARPLKRVIQQRLQNVLASEILSGRYPPGSKIKVDCQHGEFTFDEA